MDNFITLGAFDQFRPSGYVETAVTLCEDGSPIAGKILFKSD